MTAHENLNLNLTEASAGRSCCGHAPGAESPAQASAGDAAECSAPTPTATPPSETGREPT